MWRLPSLVRVCFFTRTQMQNAIFFEGSKLSSKERGIYCRADHGGSWQSPMGKRSSKFIPNPATQCIQLQPDSVVKWGRTVSSKVGPSVVLTRSSTAEQRDGVGYRGSPDSPLVWTACADLIWRAKFNCRCVDALLNKTIARLLSNWHLLNKKAKDKMWGQRDQALSSAWSTYSHRPAFWLQLVQVNCMIREWVSVSAFPNQDIHSISVKQKNRGIFLGALLSL